MATLVNQTILIVGASSGIGAQVARDVAGHGNRVVVVARRAAELAGVAADVRAAGSACLDLVADALDPASAAAVVARAVAEFGAIDVALLNVGQGPDLAVAEAGVEDIARVMALIDAARVELAPEGIRFTSLYPGFVATARVSGDGLPKPFEISEKQAARHVVRALRREPADAAFPWPTSALVRLLRALPVPVSGAVLRKLAGG